MRVLVVEDNAAVCRLVGDHLEQRGLSVLTVRTATAARTALDHEAFAVVILDLTLPDGSGLDVLTELREAGSAAHVIILTGAGAEADRVQALELGADDYIVKPFFARELAARVLAVERRRTVATDTVLQAGPVELDLAARTATVDGRGLDLTAKEFALLAFLAARPGYAFSRAELLRAVWKSAPDWQQSSTVTEHVRRLRKKIEPDPQRPRWLRTVRGSGYRFDLPADATGAEEVATDPVPAAVVIHVEGCITSADPAAVQLLGAADEGDLVGRNILDLVASASVDAAEERYLATKGGLPRRSQLVTLRRVDGAHVTVEARSSTVEWQGGSAGRIELRASLDPSARLRRLVTGVVSELSDAVIVTDLQYHIRSWNHAAERLYGWREEEVLGRHILDVLAWEGDLLTSVWESLETTGRWHGEGQQTARDGSSVSVRTSTTLVRDERGDPIGIVSVNRLSSSMPDAKPATSHEAEIRAGIDQGEFEVHYQPVVGLEDGAMITVEALVRWNHPTRGLLAPDAFIETAEQSGAIIEIGAFVLATASAQVAAWRLEGHDVGLAVNLSPAELAEPRLVGRVLDSLHRSRLDPRALWFEVTETSLVEDVDQAGVLLHGLAEHGIGIAIDDFGTGWASLTYLSRFPIHALKIDRIFVAKVDHNPQDVAIARSIVSLGAELGIAVVAEGIETVAQKEALQALGCRIGQGFLFGRPTPAVEVPVHLARRIEAPDGSMVPASPTPAEPPTGATPDALLPSPIHSGAIGVRTAPVVRLHAASRPLLPTVDSGEGDVVAGMLRSLLRVRSTDGVVELLQRTVEQLGATVVLASAAGPEALDVDLSLGEGPPKLAVTEPYSVAHLRLERILPRLVEDARHAVDLLRHTQRLEEETDRDRLTGLPNRRVLDRVLPRAKQGVVIMLDLDRFKHINDTHGHAAGDRVLADFGRALASEVRAGDVSCRIGGDEFVIVAAAIDASEAGALIDRVRAALEATAVHPVKFSAGVAAVSATGGTVALLAADRALYRAKHLGRNRTETETETETESPVAANAAPEP